MGSPEVSNPPASRTDVDRLDEMISVGSASRMRLGYLRYLRLKKLFELGEHDLVGLESLELWDSFPSRAEPLYLAARYFQSTGKLRLAKLVAEEALTLVPSEDPEWPLDDDAYGLPVELLYARLLARTGPTEEAIAHLANIIRNVQDDRELVSLLLEEIQVLTRQLDLCEVRAID